MHRRHYIIRSSLLLSLVLVVLVTVDLGALEKKKQFRALRPGEPVESVVDISETGRGYTTFRFSVPKGAFGAKLRLFDAPADLDLFVQYGSEILSYDQVDAYSMSDTYGETIFLSRLTDPPLRDGIWYVDVSYQRSEAPRVDGRRVESIPFSLELTFTDNSDIVILRPGRAAQERLLPDLGMTRRFAVDVPGYADALRIDIIDTEADIDFMISESDPISDRGSADFLRESFLGRESIVIDAESDPPLKAGRYHITVYDQVSADHPVRFSILASLDHEAPPGAAYIPPMPLAEDELETVLLSTVEVIGRAGKGSGSLVSRDGLVLTNWHVVEDHNGEASREIYIAVNMDDRYPPRELFTAELIDSEPDSDLALLRITGGLTGEPLPEAYQFPFISIGDSDRVRIGQPLSFFGYPGIGGTGSRASISLTRGIASGFEAVGERLFIKTDAEINSGNSGGAAVNAFYELVGIPTVIIGEDGGQIAFVTPVSMIPDSWIRRIGLRNMGP